MRTNKGRSTPNAVLYAEKDCRYKEERRPNYPTVKAIIENIVDRGYQGRTVARSMSPFITAEEFNEFRLRVFPYKTCVETNHMPEILLRINKAVHVVNNIISKR